MNNKKSFFDILKNNSYEAANKVASTQMMKLVKARIIQEMKNKSISETIVNKASRFLDSENGSALCSLCTGFACSYIPPFKNNKYSFYLKNEYQNGKSVLINNILKLPLVKQLSNLF